MQVEQCKDIQCNLDAATADSDCLQARHPSPGGSSRHQQQQQLAFLQVDHEVQHTHQANRERHFVDAGVQVLPADLCDIQPITNSVRIRTMERR